MEFTHEGKKYVYGGWREGMKPSQWTPDVGCNTTHEFERWKRDLEKEKQGEKDFEGYYGYGTYVK